MAQKMLLSNEILIYASLVNISIVSTGKNLKIDVMDFKNKLSGVLVITSKRIYFCNHVLGVSNTKQMTLNHITSIDDKTVLGITKIRICGVTEIFEVDGNPKINNQIQEALNLARL